MQIGGLLKFSMLDYPGKISAIIFCQGCSLRCRYCHNPELQSVTKQSDIFLSNVFDYLDKRKGKIEAVVFSGGEPLMQNDLFVAMQYIKKMGFLIGLHTSGVIPTIFEEILSLCDWIGFDIKTIFSKYESITGVVESGEFAKKSFKKMIKLHNNFEIRTTFDSRYISNKNLFEIAKMLKKHCISEWVLQQCVLNNYNSEKKILLLPNDNIINELNKIIDIKIRK